MISNIRRHWLICLLLAVVTIGTYCRVFTCDFTNYDDDIYITKNDHVRTGLTLDNIRWAFTQQYKSNWIPLTWISLMIDHDLSSGSQAVTYEGREDPSAYHVTNLVLHIVNTILLFLLLAGLTGARWRSAMVAALFALHPLHVESVAWVAERKDVLSTLFLLLTIIAYSGYVSKPCAKRYALVVAFLILGMLAKPMLVTLPICLLLLDIWPFKRLSGKQPGGNWRSLVLEKLPLMAIAAAASVATVIAQNAGGAVKSTEMFPVGVRVANAVYATGAYLWKTFCPVHLACYYPHPGDTLPVWLTICIGVAFAAATVFAAACWRRRPYVTVGWLWYLITLLPVIGLVQVGKQGMADRYAYIPLIGIFIAFVWGLSDLLAKVGWGRQALRIAAVAVLVALSALTFVQVGYWQNSLTAFSHAIAVTGPNAQAHVHVGAYYSDLGQIDDAIDHYSQAVSIDPSLFDVRNNLALMLVQKGRVDEAIDHLQAAVRLMPKLPDLHLNLGLLLVQRDRLDEGIAQLRIANRLNPRDAQIAQLLATYERKQALQSHR